MKKFISYLILCIGSVIVVLTFVTATSVVQLVIASALYILVSYLALITFPRKVIVKPIITNQNIANTVTEEETGEVADDNKRNFLKLISISGLSLLVYWIFTKKGKGPLFGGSEAETGAVTLQNTEGVAINPAEQQATDGYKITEVDDSIIAYYGFIHKNDSWFIMRLDTDSGSFRYTRGKAQFAGSWTDREKLTYDYYTNVF